MRKLLFFFPSRSHEEMSSECRKTSGLTKKAGGIDCNMTDSTWFSDYMPDSLLLLKKRRTDVCSHSHPIRFLLHENEKLIESEMWGEKDCFIWELSCLDILFIGVTKWLLYTVHAPQALIWCKYQYGSISASSCTQPDAKL